MYLPGNNTLSPLSVAVRRSSARACKVTVVEEEGVRSTLRKATRFCRGRTVVVVVVVVVVGGMRYICSE